MTWLRKLPDSLAAIRGMGATRQFRYAAIVLAIAGLFWSCWILMEIRRGDESSRAKTAELRKVVADFRLQVKRQQAVKSSKAVETPDEEATAETLVARVGTAARQAGLQLAQSRVIQTPPSAQPAPPASPAAPSGPGGQNRPAPPPPADPGGVEFHLTGSYSSLQRLLKEIGRSRLRFQVVTLDVLRAKVTETTGAAQLDIRLICLL